MKKMMIGMLATCLLWISGTALAETSPGDVPATSSADSTVSAEVKGWRYGFDLALGQASATGNMPNLSTSTLYGLAGQLVYDINRYVAIEGDVAFNGGATAGAANVGTTAYTLDVLGFYPVAKDFDVYGLIGYGSMGTTLSASNGAGGAASYSQSAVKIGFGIDLGRSLPNGLRVGFETYDSGYTRSNMLLIGPMFRF